MKSRLRSYANPFELMMLKVASKNIRNNTKFESREKPPLKQTIQTKVHLKHLDAMVGNWDNVWNACQVSLHALETLRSLLQNSAFPETGEKNYSQEQRSGWCVNRRCNRKTISFGRQVGDPILRPHCRRLSFQCPEDGPGRIPNLAELIHRRGIDPAMLQKTVQLTAELEVKLNATYNFFSNAVITEEGSNKKLVPRSGPFLQGLKNLGNSCYLNSVAQLLFHLPEFAR
jgi:hypothetical protein